MTFCTKCGSQINDDAAFCPSCGQETNRIQTTDNGAYAPASSAPGFSQPNPPVHNTPLCYYHSNEPAVAQCAICGKYICRDCYDTYGFTVGEYAGQAMCYDCTKQLVADNISNLKSQKTGIITLFVATVIGMIIGLAVGASGGAALAVLCMLWFGSFWTWVKSTFTGWSSAGFSMAGFIGAFIGGLIIAPIKTIIKIFQCISYLTKTSKFIEQDTAALSQMKDYMEYTVALSQNKNADIDNLMNNNTELANNSFAQMVRSQGETAAEENIKQCVATVNQNGEVIRNFNGA